jgi:hypothetical protein
MVSILLDNWISFEMALIVGMGICIFMIAMYLLLWKSNIYNFIIIPVAASYLLMYILFEFFRFGTIIYEQAPFIAYITLVISLTIAGSVRHKVLKSAYMVNNAQNRLLYASVHDAFYIGQVIQNCFTIYLFCMVLYLQSPYPNDVELDRIIHHYVTFALCVGIIIYNHIRQTIWFNQSKKETWLPMLNAKGKVLGRIPYDVAVSNKRYLHPVVRIAVIYKSMLYLVPRQNNVPVSPKMLDYPLTGYVLFHDTIEKTSSELTEKITESLELHPRLMLRYTFENDNLRQLVSLYVIAVKTEEQMKYFKGGKWWTSRQIEEDIASDIFSEYFVKEYPYLQNTIIMAESMF